jgi:hypothetical protein
MGVNTTRRILGEARKARPPTKSELTDPEKAYFYAFEKISRRFPEGEAAIATSPYWSYHYARRVIRGRFPEAEAAIATSRWALNYAWHVIHELEAGGRWPEAEEAIAKDPEDAKFYLEHFPEAKLEWAMNGWLDWLDL